MSLKDVYLKEEYRSPRDNVVRDFYIPLLEKSILYKRNVGFFSSSSLFELSYGISKLIANGGKIQLIASAVLSDEDIQAINEGYKQKEKTIEDAILKSIEEPKTIFEEERLNILATLISDGRLDIKIAFSLNNNRMGLYHEKSGLMYDNEGNIVAFSGSMNESKNAFYSNYDIFDVFTSWSDNNRVVLKDQAFERLWNNIDENAVVFDFPRAAQEKLLTYKKHEMDMDIDEKEFKKEYKYISHEEKIKLNTNEPRIPSGVELFPYQKEAIEKWIQNDFCGIFDMATGTGKTYTGLGAIVELYKRRKPLAVIIVCPQKHLVNQWVEDILDFNINPIIGHSESAQKDFKKRLKMGVFDLNLGVKNFLCFVCTNATFSSIEVQKAISEIKKDVLLVVDEAHNIGAQSYRIMLDDRFKYRLALSATIDRHGDEEGTKVLYDFFREKCIEFSLEKAIKGGFLTQYEYHPIMVNLTDEELLKYHEYSKMIRVGKDGKLTKYGEIMAQKRARLVAGAYNKVQLLKQTIEKYKDDNYILVYCGATTISEDEDVSEEEIRQIDKITSVLGNDLQMKVAQFTSRESNKQRAMLIEKFSEGEQLQTLIAIKCLDEGVNIPAIKMAFILASTTNPKEYIQRRGRVLRKFKGKDKAIIYDFVTLPRKIEDAVNLTNAEIACEKRMVLNELTRIEDFKKLALNSMESDKLICQIKDSYHLYDDIIKFEGDY